MITKRLKRTLPLALATATVTLLAAVSGAEAATEAPIKEALSSHIGAEVDMTSGGNICTVESKDTCQYGKSSSEPGQFSGAESIAVDTDPASPEHGDVYVADRQNHRVQVLTSTGEFVLMFGEEVNETKVNAAKAKGGAQTQQELEEENLCTEDEITESNVKCKTGVQGVGPGRFNELESVAADPASGNVYVAERIIDPNGNGETTIGNRVQELTGGGGFVLEIGKGVNETSKVNLCTQEEVEKLGVKCGGPTQRPLNAPYEWGNEHGAFNFEGTAILASGGPRGLLYVGDEHRVQEFEVDGKWMAEIPLASISPELNSTASPVTVDSSCSLHRPVLTESTTPTCKEFDPSYGDVYLVYSNVTTGIGHNIVREFDSSGAEVKHVELSDMESAADEPIEIASIAIDAAGRLAVSEREHSGRPNRNVFRGSVYQVAAPSSHLLTEFTDVFPDGPSSEFGSTDAAALAFSDSDELFAVGDTNEVLSFVPLPVGELLTSPVSCVAGAEGEIGATVACSLNGEVNPWGVSETDVAFQWGKTTALGSETAAQNVAAGSTPVRVSAPLTGLLPNEMYYARLVGHDHNIRPPEGLGSERISFTTPAVPPTVLGESSVSFVGPFSAVLTGGLNPENASTEYFFEYGRCEQLVSCGVVLKTMALKSAMYGRVGTNLEATGLQPASTYRYRLVVISALERAEGPEESFTTAPAPAPQVASGPPSVGGAPAPAPSVLSAPVPLAQLPVPNIAFPTTAAPVKVAATHKKAHKKSKKAKRKRAKARKSSVHGAQLHGRGARSRGIRTRSR